MADLNLKGPLNLMGNLTLKGGKVKVNGAEALVEVTPSDPAQCSAASPVIIPTPPAAPLQPQPTVWIVNSFNKTVKAIAVLTKERAPMLPDVKSSWEQGFKDLEASTWFSFMAPKGTPEPVIKRLHDATVTAMEDKEVQRQMLASGAIIEPPERRSTEYLREYMAKEIEKNGAPIRAAGLSIE